MGFKLIDPSTWGRKEYFDHYFHRIPCSYSITLNLDVTTLLKEIKREGIKLYPTMIYLLSTMVNRHEEFRTAIDDQGRVGIFHLLHPSYTIMEQGEERFTNLWSEYTPTFSDFYQNYLRDVEGYGEIKGFIGKPNRPENVFYVSSIPWVSFTGFNLHLPKETNFLQPIFTIGKYVEQHGKVELPLAIQVHHAVCDGFHIGRFVNELQEVMNDTHSKQLFG